MQEIAVGLSIKREQTEQLARQVSQLTGESLTEAVHGALEHRLAQLGHRLLDRATERQRMEAFLVELDARPIKDNRSLKEMELDFYDDLGNPIA